MRSLIVTLGASLVTATAAAQAASPPEIGSAALETIASVARPQQWFMQPVWRCPQRDQTAQRAVAEIQQQMATLGTQGWEPVSFGQANVDGSACFFAMLKKPKWP